MDEQTVAALLALAIVVGLTLICSSLKLFLVLAILALGAFFGLTSPDSVNTDGSSNMTLAQIAEQTGARFKSFISALTADNKSKERETESLEKLRKEIEGLKEDLAKAIDKK